MCAFLKLKSPIFFSTTPPNFIESLKIGFLETLKETPGTYPPLAVCSCESFLNYFPTCFLSVVIPSSHFSDIRECQILGKKCSLSGSNQNGRWPRLKGWPLLCPLLYCLPSSSFWSYTQPCLCSGRSMPRYILCHLLKVHLPVTANAYFVQQLHFWKGNSDGISINHILFFPPFFHL